MTSFGSQNLADIFEGFDLHLDQGNPLLKMIIATLRKLQPTFEDLVVPFLVISSGQGTQVQEFGYAYSCAYDEPQSCETKVRRGELNAPVAVPAPSLLWSP